jgi:hypothetical protein
MGYSDETTFDDYEAITPSDTVAAPKMRAIYVGVSGNVAVKNGAGVTVTFIAVPVGILRITAPFVLATGTTATNMIAMRQV